MKFFSILRCVLLWVFLITNATCLAAATVQNNVPYRPELSNDEYAQKMCVLDVYWPDQDVENASVLIWYHGGGLEGGSKSGKLTKAMAEHFVSQGVIVIVPNYRLSPEVKFPTYLEDSATAVHFAQTQICPSGTDTPIFIGGHSAGGYIASMLALDPQYLQDAGVELTEIDGFIPMSGQMMTHFTVAKERGIARPSIIADAAAPIYHIKKETAPILIIIGGDDWPARLEETRYFVAAMRKEAKNESISLVEVSDRNHGSILKGMSSPSDPAEIAALRFIRTGQLPPDHLIATE